MGVGGCHFWNFPSQNISSDSWLADGLRFLLYSLKARFWGIPSKNKIHKGSQRMGETPKTKKNPLPAFSCITLGMTPPPSPHLGRPGRKASTFTTSTSAHAKPGIFGFLPLVGVWWGGWINLAIYDGRKRRCQTCLLTNIWRKLLVHEYAEFIHILQYIYIHMWIYAWKK